MTEPSSGFSRYTRAKKWKSLILGAGHEWASAFPNDTQLIERDNVRQVLNVLLSEQAILKGCDLVFLDSTHIIISAGQVLVDGIVHDVEEQSFTISGVGTETVGLKVTLVVVSHNDDLDLLDPAEGFDGFGAPYARAETYTTAWTVNDPTALAFFDLRDGVLQILKPPPQIDGIGRVLARRTFDENNHFRIAGLTASIKEKDNDNMLLKIESGKAYIMGFEVIIPGDRNIVVPKAKSALPIVNEFHTFLGGTNLYALGTTPVKQVTLVTANIQVVEEVVSRSNYPPIITDHLVKVNVTKILSVAQTGNPDSPFVEGSDFVLTNDSVDFTPSLTGGHRPVNGTTYKVTYLYQKVLVLGARVKTDVVENLTKGTADGQDNLAHGDIIAETVVVTKGATTYQQTTDYLVVAAKGATTGGKINWSPGGVEPSPSDSYTVSYSYWAHSTEGDYTAYNSYDTLIYAPDRNSIDFSPVGDDPYATAPYNTFSIGYDYFVPRRDVVVIDKDGIIAVIQGAPKFFDPKPPLIPANTLGLHELRYPPDSMAVTIITFDTLVVQQPELQQLRRRVLALEFDVGQKDLDQEARTRLPGQALKGIWTDNFTSLEGKADWLYPNFDVLYSISDGAISLPRDLAQYDGVLNTSGGASTVQISSTLLTLPFTTVVIVSQPFASEAINVNPYDVFGLRPNINLDPEKDVGFGAIVIATQYPPTTVPTPQTIFAWEQWWMTFKQTLPQDLPGLNLTFQQFLALSGAAPVVQQAVLGHGVATPTVTFLDGAFTVGGTATLRQRTVTILGDRYTPNANNLEATFDGVRVALTAVGPTSLPGTTAGTIRANAAGEAVGTFAIPANVSGVGGKIVTLGNVFESADAIYTASFSRGVKLSFPFDPVAQSFVLPNDRILSGVRLWFKKKSSVQSIQVILRTVRENGEPGDQVLATAKVKAPNVNISADATLSTNFIFDDPVLLSAGVMYAFTVFSPSNEYEIWVGRGGYFDIPTNQPIRVNPYTPGVLFLSANNRTWTPDQAADLKFQLLAAKFSPLTAVAKFNNIPSVSLTSFVFLDEQTVPSGTDLKWEYSVNGGTTWLPTTALQLQGLSQDYSGVTFVLRATFTGSGDGWLSPLLVKDSLHLITYRNKLNGLYANLNIQLPDPSTFVTLKVWHQAYIPAGTTVSAFYSIDGGINWVELTSPTTTIIDEMYTESAYSETVSAQTEYKVKLEMTTGSAPKQRIIVPVVRRLQTLVY